MGNSNKKSKIGLLAFILILSIWMISGSFKEDASTSKKDFTPKAKFFKVQVEHLKSSIIEETIELTGITIPARRVILKSETRGIIEDTYAQRGSFLKEGDVIVQIELKDRTQLLAQAQAIVKQRQQEYDASKNLIQKDFIPEVRLTESLAALESANASLAAIENDIRATKITAPFDGKLQDRIVEKGTYVKVADPIAEVVELNPLAIKGDVIESDIQHLSAGMSAYAILVTGEKLEGTLRYIAPAADLNSRTFLIELEVENPRNVYFAGITSKITIPLENVEAHKLSAALLTLDKEGALGVKVIENENKVKFRKVEIIQAEDNYIWVKGLPHSIQLITIGQDFVKDGETVVVIEKSNS